MTSGPLTPAPLPPGEGKRASISTVSVQTARTGASTKANELGMRAMQERAYARRGEQYLVIKPPYAKMTAALPSPDGRDTPHAARRRAPPGMKTGAARASLCDR